MKLDNILKKILPIFDILAPTGIVTLMAYQMGHLTTEFPAGTDTYAYLTRIRLILDWFPHINWNAFWDSGVPFWIWSHPPLSMLLAAAMVKILGLTPEASLIALAAGSFILLGLGIYGFAYLLTESRLVGILTVILTLGSPASWAWWNGGNYTRVFGLGFLGLSLFFISGYLKYFKINKIKGKWFYVGAIITSALAYTSHLLNGGFIAVLTILLVFFSIYENKEKIIVAIKLILPGLLLSAYWYLPLFLTSSAGSRFFGRNPAAPIPWSYLWTPDPDKNWNYALIPIYLSLFLPMIGILLFGLAKQGRQFLSEFSFKVWLGFLLFCGGNFIYNFIGHLPFYPEKFYINGFPPTSAFPAFAIFFGASIGILIGLLIKRKIVLSLILIFVFGLIWLNFDYFKKAAHETNVGQPNSLESLSDRVIRVTADKNFRFGTDSSFVADWFNYKYDVPQTRDYFAQGIPYPDWLSWFEKSVWFLEENYEETNFLLDWYAVREFFVGEPHFKYDKFKNREDYLIVNSETVQHSWGLLPFYEFSFPHAGPILAANNAPTILFIGKKQDYDVFFRALSLTGFDSQNILPINGGEVIDDYNLEELRRFKALFLSNYRYRNSKKAFDLLGSYVKSGGNLWLEVANSQEKDGKNLPEIFPVSEENQQEIREWNFVPAEGLPSGVDVSRIPPPEYEGTAWKAVLGTGPRPWAQPVLLREGQVLMAKGQLGDGQVIWSGMNFPFHLTTTRNLEEAELFKEFLKDWVGLEGNVLSGQATFVNPEKREILLANGTHGLLFKESYLNNWQASAYEGKNKKRLEILRTGPDLMYVFVPKGTQKIVFEYHISWIEKIGWLISLATLFLVILYSLEAFTKKPLFSSIAAPLSKLVQEETE